MTTKNTSFEAWLPLAAALVSVVLWAGAFVGIRAAGRSFSPGALALGRLTIGSVLLGAIAAMRPFVRPTRRELLLLVLAGLLWFGVYNIVLNDADKVARAGGSGRSFSVISVTIPSIPSDPTKRPIKSNPVLFL